jgi:hypothetical protein
MNHDALFKMLLRNRPILRAFFEQFFPGAAKFIEFDKIEYVDKELVTLEGKRRTGDLLIKTSFRGRTAGFLIHLEHQAQRSSDLSWRMLEYLVLDRREYELPVYPIAVLSYPNSQRENRGRLVLDFPNKRVLDFNFDIIDLARLDASVFVQCRNPAALALAARMKFDAKERISLVRDFFLSLASSPVDRAEMALVAGFFSAYQPLDRREELQLQQELSILKPDQLREKVMQLTTMRRTSPRSISSRAMRQASMVFPKMPMSAHAALPSEWACAVSGMSCGSTPQESRHRIRSA